ncbi:MAG: CBS domain-containing protein [Caldilinea sp. CFX5]|nr:CBS domain-containing protein [Caldilinea sp. CFX5]
MNNMRLGERERTLTETLRSGEQPQWWRAVRVRDVMATALLCVDSLTTVPEAQRLMQEHRIRRLPVIDDGKLVGIITQGDVRGALPSEATTLNRTEQAYLMNQVKVDRIMHTNVLTIRPEASLADAARLMVQHKIGGLPVLADDGAVIGIVTESDIFGAFVKIFDALDALNHQDAPAPDNSD